MRFGAQLPLIDFDEGVSWAPPTLYGYVDAARDGGFTAIGANDHLVFQRPWLDGIVALASVVERSAGLTLATTVSLPVVRGPVALAKAAAALQILSQGRFVLGVGPGSSEADYRLAGVPFDERWPRFDEAVHILRTELVDPASRVARRFYDTPVLEPRPRPPTPVWIGSWGSAAGLRRVARLGDGWLASAYNTTPQQLAYGRESLRAALRSADRDEEDLPIALATMWTYVTDRTEEAQAKLTALAATLQRDPTTLADQVLIGSAESSAEKLSRYAAAGADTVFIWPLGDPVEQVRRFGEQVIDQVA